MKSKLNNPIDVYNHKIYIHEVKPNTIVYVIINILQDGMHKLWRKLTVKNKNKMKILREVHVRTEIKHTQNSEIFKKKKTPKFSTQLIKSPRNE